VRWQSPPTEQNMKLKQLFFILFSLFTLHFSLQAREPLPLLVEGGEPLNKNFYINPRSSINAVAISKDGKTIVSGSDDGSIKVWDSEKGVLLKTLEGHTGDVNSVAITIGF